MGVEVKLNKQVGSSQEDGYNPTWFSMNYVASPGDCDRVARKLY